MRKASLLNHHELMLNGRIFPLHYDSSAKDGLPYSLESSPDPRRARLLEHQSLFKVSYLSEVTPEALPKGLEISAYKPDIPYQFIDFLTITNPTKGNCQIHLSMTFHYSKWDYPLNLAQWSASFKRNLELRVSGLAKISENRNEYGIYFICTVPIAERDDIFKAFENAVSDIGPVYYESLDSAHLYRDSRKTSDVSGSSNLGFRWWAQQVIVPLLASGTFTALVAWLLSR